MENINIISFLFDIFQVIINGAGSLWRVLNYRIPLTGILTAVGKILEFFGAEIDFTSFDGASISIMTIAGALLGTIIIFVIIKKIIPLL